VQNLQIAHDVSSYFQSYGPSGILKPGSDPRDGIFNVDEDPMQHGGIGAGELPPTDLKVTLMMNSHTRPECLRFLEHADLRIFVRDIMRWDKEVLLQRTMLRHNVPGALSTAVHYDKLFLREGDAYFLTAWVPIGRSA
jgi:phytanoyl-CoA hydroxylase